MGMALETLKDINQINGFDVKRVEWNHPAENFIEVNDRCNAITFKIQDGPIKEVGKNGCQVDELISTALFMIKGINAKFSCDEKVKAMTSLYEAYSWLQQRKANREARGVEG